MKGLASWSRIIFNTRIEDLLDYHHTKFHLNIDKKGRVMLILLALAATFNFYLVFRIYQSLFLATTVPVFISVSLKMAEIERAFFKLALAVSWKLWLAFRMCWGWRLGLGLVYSYEVFWWEFFVINIAMVTGKITKSHSTVEPVVLMQRLLGRINVQL